MTTGRKVTDWVRPQPGDIRSEVLRLALRPPRSRCWDDGRHRRYLPGGSPGAESLAAVGLANQWIFLSGTFFGALGTGSTALIARFIGAKEPEQRERGTAPVGAAGDFDRHRGVDPGLVPGRAGGDTPGARGEVVALSSTYLKIVSVALVVAPLMYLGNASLRGAGDTQTPLRIMLVVNAVNIVVAVTTINGLLGVPKMGWPARPWAATAQVTGGVLVTAVLLRGRGQIRLRLNGLRPDRT